MDPFIDPLAISIISQLRQNTEQEELEYTPEVKSTWQMIRELGGWLMTNLRQASLCDAPAEDCAYAFEVTTTQFDKNDVCAEA
jgi:hypothetical protein